MLNYLNLFIPKSEIPKCACYVLYDWHPRDNKLIDITVCSNQGEIQEFYKKDLLCSVKVDIETNYRHIKILRNHIGELFYLVVATGEIIILSRKENLQIHRRVNHVRDYKIVDSACSGEATLQILTSSGVIHLSIGNNFEIRNQDVNQSGEVKPVIDMFKQKLQEAKDSLQSNEEALQKIIDLRQLVTYGSQLPVAGQMNTLKPNVVICNEKLVIMVEMENQSLEPMDNVCALIHNNSSDSISYTTKLFEILSSSPFYKDMQSQEIKCNQSALVAVVIPLKEFNSTINSKIEFKLAISYQRHGNVFLQSCENVYVSASERMGKKFDVFKRKHHTNDKLIISAILSTSEKTTLCFKQINHDNVNLLIIFCEYLKMKMLQNNIAVHKHSPHHILYGIMIHFQDSCYYDVYSRSPSQVLALLHFINDRFPQKLIVTTPKVTIKEINSHSQDGDEDFIDNLPNLDYIPNKLSFIKQATMTLEYFDECLKEMNKNKNSNFHDMLGKQIDIFTMGYDRYVEYRNKMLTEVENYEKHLLTNTDEMMEVEDTDS